MLTNRPAPRSFLRVEVLRHLPGKHARGAQVAHLAGHYERVQGVDGFLHRRTGIEAVDLVEIDEIGCLAVPAMRRRIRSHSFGIGPSGYVILGVCTKEALGRDHHVMAIDAELFQRSPQGLPPTLRSSTYPPCRRS